MYGTSRINVFYNISYFEGKYTTCENIVIFGHNSYKMVVKEIISIKYT